MAAGCSYGPTETKMVRSFNYLSIGKFRRCGWSRPSRLPAEINTPGREENPVLHSDGKHCTSPRMAMWNGGLDPTCRTTATVHGPQRRIWDFINSSGDENSLQVFLTAGEIVRHGQRRCGKLEWQFQLPDFASAESVALWRGDVRDADESANRSESTGAGNPIGAQQFFRGWRIHFGVPSGGPYSCS